MNKSKKLRNEIIQPYSYLILALSIIIILISTFVYFSSSIRYLKEQELIHSSHIKSGIVNFLDSPFKVNQQNADLFKLGIFQESTPEEVRILFSDQYKNYDNLTLIGFGLEDGTYFDLQYLDGNNLYFSIRDLKAGICEGMRVDKSGTIISVESTYKYDHRVRPWYVTAKENRLGWTLPYVSINPKAIFITAFNSLENESNKFLGTVVSSISLTEVSNIIRSINSLGNKEVYILENDGKIIASSGHEDPFKVVDGEPSRIYAKESRNKVLSYFFSSEKILEDEITLKWLGLKPYFIGVYSINDHRGIDWKMVIINPFEKLFLNIIVRLLTIIIFALLTIGIGILIGGKIGVGICKPILEIKNAADQIVLGNLDTRVKIYKDDEVGEMGISFNRMGDTIYELVNKLEEKVEERTKKLYEANKELQNSENKFHTLSDAAFEGIVFSENGVILEVNKLLAEILGYKPEELIGMRSTDFIAEELREDAIKRVMSNDVSSYETVGVTKDGTKIPVAIQAKMFTYKGREVRVSAVRDLSDQKKAEEEINTLRSILPICSYCKKIRNDKGYYEQIEAYIKNVSDVDFTHTICPDCLKEHFNEYLPDDDD